ncbi:hypothetical protein ACFL6D_02745 [Spirochaetota bacterium]
MIDVDAEIYSAFTIFRTKSKISEMNITMLLGNFASKAGIELAAKNGAGRKNIVDFIYLKSVYTCSNNVLYFLPQGAPDRTLSNSIALDSLFRKAYYSVAFIDPLNADFNTSCSMQKIQLKKNQNIVLLADDNNRPVTNIFGIEESRFITLMSNFYKKRDGLNPRKKTDGYSVYDLIEHFSTNGCSILGKKSSAKNVPFIEYTYIKPQAETNIYYEEAYSNIEVPEKVEFFSRNFVGYKRIIPKHTIRRKIGLQEKMKVEGNEGRWE